MSRPMSGAPTTLSIRHQHMAYLFAAGKTVAEIARALHYSENRVSVVKSSAVFQDLLARIRQEITARTVDDIVASLVAEAPASVERMRTLREQDDNLAVAYNASAFFLEKHPSVVALKASADLGVKILLDDAAVLRMERAIAESEGRAPQALPVGSPDADVVDG